MRERRRARLKLSPKITLCVEEIPTSYTAALGFFIACGARHESKKLSGVTHLCEHLFFKKTSTRNAVEISRQSERMGGELNAYTDREMTSFHADCPVEQFSEMFQIVLEMLLDPHFDAKDFDSERDVVAQEIVAYEDNPEDIFNDLTLEVPWDGHPLGLRIGGTSKDVRALELDSTYRYLEEVFLPSPWVISVVSPLSIREVKNIITQQLQAAKSLRFAKTLQKLKKPEARGATPRLKRPWAKRSLAHTLESEQVQVSFAYPGLHAKHRDEVQLAALGSIMGVGASSFLYRELREKAGLVYHCSANHQAFTDAGLLMGQWSCGPETYEEAAFRASEICAKLSKGVAQSDIDYMKECLTGATKMSFDGLRGRMDSMGRQEIILGRSYDLSQTLDEVKKIRKGGVDRYARTLREMPSLLMVGPLGKREMKRLEKAWLAGQSEGLRASKD
ncbi:MAG: pitrilysin family protein [Bdellovibrionota bacterium]